jgi:hypothetical protein
MAPYVAGTFLFAVVAWLVYYFYVNASHNVKPWRTVKGRLMDLAESEGFTVDRERCTAYGELEGVPFAFGLKTVRRGKSRHMQLWAALESSEIPLDLEVSAECVLSGVSRALGYKEATLGEPEFDAAFWILTDDVEQARNFLTPSRRRGFLHGLTAVSDGKIKKQKVQAIQRFSTPLRMSRHFRPLLENFRLLAETLNESGERLASLPEGRSGVVAQKVRRFARTSSVFLLIGLFVFWHPHIIHLQWIWWSLALGLALSVAAAVKATETTRVLLQAYFAFLAAEIMVFVGVGLYSVYRHFDENHLMAVLLVGLVGLALCWGSRNYLKSMDQTKAAVRDNNLPSEL